MSDRSLSAKEAEKLNPGSDHYRAYVGPPKRFGFMSLTQTAIMFAFDLRETDAVLDFGCGSLRLGRMLIPYLRKGGYFGIEPHKWLVEDGIANELGQDAVAIKEPNFAYSDDFDCTVFNRQFDFIIAQSIVTHAGPAMANALFKTASQSLKKDGIFLISYKRGTDQTPLPADEWSYPANIEYAPSDMLGMLESAGLAAVEIPWFHPGAQWVAASLDPARLPSDDEMLALNGRPVQRRPGDSSRVFSLRSFVRLCKRLLSTANNP